MSVTELKIKRIEKINQADEKLLQEILDRLAFESDDKIYMTTNEEKSVVSEAQEQIKKRKIF